MPLFKHHDNQTVDPNAVPQQQPVAGGLSQPGAANPGAAGYAANAPGVIDPNAGVTGGHHQHHLGRDAALGAGAVGVAEHEHHKHQNAALANDPNYNNTATGGGHHLGRDAALGAGAVGVGEHEHHKHHNAGLANDPNYNNTATGGGHHLGRDAALGAGAVGVAEHEHHKHHGHTGVGSGVGAGHAVQDPATMGPEGNPLYPSPHAPVADRLTGHTGTGADGHTGMGVGAGAGAGAAAAGAGADGPLHSSQVTTSSGKSPSTQAMIGKVEHAIGTVIGSSTLKAKGLAKEEEAIAVKNQKAELQEAERLEGHANLARDRAAAHAATGNVHGHAKEAVGNYGAGPTAVGELSQTGGGYQSIGGAGTARPF